RGGWPNELGHPYFAQKRSILACAKGGPGQIRDAQGASFFHNRHRISPLAGFQWIKRQVGADLAQRSVVSWFDPRASWSSNRSIGSGPAICPLAAWRFSTATPAVGKSLLTLDLAARLTTGRQWPDGKPSPGPASVVLLCDEDFDNILLARLN